MRAQGAERTLLGLIEDVVEAHDKLGELIRRAEGHAVRDQYLAPQAPSVAREEGFEAGRKVGRCEGLSDKDRVVIALEELDSHDMYEESEKLSGRSGVSRPSATTAPATIEEQIAALPRAVPHVHTTLPEEDDKDLPTMASLVGAAPGITGGKGSVEFVREIRDNAPGDAVADPELDAELEMWRTEGEKTFATIDNQIDTLPDHPGAELLNRAIEVMDALGGPVHPTAQDRAAVARIFESRAKPAETVRVIDNRTPKPAPDEDFATSITSTHMESAAPDVLERLDAVGRMGIRGSAKEVWKRLSKDAANEIRRLRAEVARLKGGE